ncbi:beta-lactamase [Halovivax asiaticus JCM 14624]|uniref:Beta-lactamase n=1 Tax=Halovivax asiaticus JCM 14624 TaxID=1227490 RepID=M0BF84_9EURY|nr:MBL fold metallo-hydrolase [Halovivax asiaticus]ELZ08963.1 beta-lactamase [Halovivax asiaticus JCM 14624]
MSRRALLVLVVTSIVLLGGCLEALPDGTSIGAADEPSVVDELEGDDVLEIHHIDVGQGDATVVLAPNGETMVIDSGDWHDDGEQVLSFLADRGIDRVDHLVSTHGHSDHIGGHAAIIEHFETQGDGVGTVYDSGVAHTSETYDGYLDAVETHDVSLKQVQSGDTFDLGAVEARILNPPTDSTSDDIDANGVVLRLDYGDVSYLTTGDAGADAESRLAETQGSALDVDIYQAGHHGSSTSSTSAFLDAVDPSMTVISSAQDSQYGHPHDEVLQSFADRDVETYWTGVHGDVLVATDGESIAVDTATDVPTDAAALRDEKPVDGESRLPPPATVSPGALVVGILPLTARTGRYP